MSFEEWLVSRQYRPSTITTSLRDARQLERMVSVGAAPPRRLRAVAKRLLGWAEAGGWLPEPVGAACVALCAPAPRTRGLGGHRTVQRKHRAESWPDAEWPRLLTAIAEARADAPRAVLLVLAGTGLRVGDVLRLDVAELQRGVRAGRLHVEVKGGSERILDPSGAPDAWAALVEACDGYGTVAEACAPGGDGRPDADGAAYAAVARWLRKLAKRADCTGRAHLHRLRRTVAVQALRATGGDVEAVRQLLGHHSAQTTRRYLDEATPEQDAELARTIRRRFAGGAE